MCLCVCLCNTGLSVFVCVCMRVQLGSVSLCARVCFPCPCGPPRLRHDSTARCLPAATAAPPPPGSRPAPHSGGGTTTPVPAHLGPFLFGGAAGAAVRGGAVRCGPGAGRGPAGEGRAPAAAGAVPPRRHAPPRWRRQRAGGGRRGGAACLELLSAAPLRSVRHPFGYPRGPTSGRPKVSPFPLSATVGVQQPWGAAVIGRQ